MSRVLVTGAAGFVGRTLVRTLIAAGHSVTASVRGPLATPLLGGVDIHNVGDIGPDTDWSDALTGIDAVAHLAARVHVTRDTASDPAAEFSRVNVDGTHQLVEQMVAAGVRRLVFTSTVKVNGNATPVKPFTESDASAPEDPYAVSKLEAEKIILSLAARSGLEAVILRPPLVYGEGVRGNFRTLLRLCRLPMPIPVGGTTNARSLIYVGNLASAVARCLWHPRAAGRIYFVSDGEDVSTADLVQRVCETLDGRSRTLRMPTSLLRLVGRLSGRSTAVSKLVDSLTVDDTRIREELDWQPPFTMQQGLARTAKWFQSEG